MNDPIDERLRSYYRSIQTDPPLRLERRVEQAITAPSAARGPAWPVRRLGFAAAALVVAAVLGSLALRGIGPGPVASPSLATAPASASAESSATVGPSVGPSPSATPSETPTASGPATPTVSPTARPSLSIGSLGPVFSRAASLGRTFYTATLLEDGRVLIAGGLGSGEGAPAGPLKSAELYDPATNKFSPTGSMTVARYQHTATLLADGRVLMAGGADMQGGAGNLASAEVYDPKTGKFMPTGSMAVGRARQTATLLLDDRVLIAGGMTDLPLNECELYDPTTGTFGLTGPMTAVRADATATLLGSGLVLIAGGLTVSPTSTISVTPTASAERYDPTTGTFSATGSMAFARASHNATLTAGGLVLITGGVDSNGKAVVAAEDYDQDNGVFSVASQPETSRGRHADTFLLLGTVLLAGGDGSSPTTVEVYSDSVGTVWQAPTGLSDVAAAIPTAKGVLLLDPTATAWQFFIRGPGLGPQG